MAKQSKIAKNMQRQKLVDKYSEKRKEYSKEYYNSNLWNKKFIVIRPYS